DDFEIRHEDLSRAEADPLGPGKGAAKVQPKAGDEKVTMPYRLLSTMEGRDFVTYDELKDKVHRNPGVKDGTVETNVGRANIYLEAKEGLKRRLVTNTVSRWVRWEKMR